MSVNISDVIVLASTNTHRHTCRAAQRHREQQHNNEHVQFVASLLINDDADADVADADVAALRSLCLRLAGFENPKAATTTQTTTTPA